MKNEQKRTLNLMYRCRIECECNEFVTEESLIVPSKVYVLFLFRTSKQSIMVIES